MLFHPSFVCPSVRRMGGFWLLRFAVIFGLELFLFLLERRGGGDTSMPTYFAVRR